MLFIAPVVVSAKPQKTGLLVVDLQQHFLAPVRFDAATDAALDVTIDLLGTAKANGAPIFVTYESSKYGDHALPEKVEAAVPLNAKSFVKTKYAATKLPALVTALEKSGVTHLVVTGAETDVCVLLTVLGLRELGYHVTVVRDGVVSSEPYLAPAFARMELAGVVLASSEGATRLLMGEFPPSDVEFRQRNLLIEPLKNAKENVALIVSGFPATSGDETSCGLPAREARFEQLLIMAEWLELPVYVSGEALDLMGQAHVRPLEELDAAKYGFLVVAGSEREVRVKLQQIGAPRRVFAITDAMTLEGDGLRTPGFVPLTYKTFYREITGSVSYDDWISPRWTKRISKFMTRLEDPESLPAMLDACPAQYGDSGSVRVR